MEVVAIYKKSCGSTAYGRRPSNIHAATKLVRSSELRES